MADIAEEYRSSLSELNFNSKPHINMLTMLAEENIQHAPLIVQTIVDHVNSVPPDIKLPTLYLVDSIVKNIGKSYVSLFSKHLVSLFTSVFEKVDENIRSLLYKLRSTWTNIFPNAVLLHLDKSVILLDPAWPILAQHANIHVNPKFFDKSPVQLKMETEPAPTPHQALLKEVEMKKKQLELLKVLQEKKEQLMQLQKKAALKPVMVEPQKLIEPAKVETKKPVNARDPRLSKKVPAASVASDSTVLHSVVVVPGKKHDKDSPSPKKAKVDGATPIVKKHAKSKLNSDSVGFENNKKINDINVNPGQSIVPPQSCNTHKTNRGKKRPNTPDNAREYRADSKQSNKKPLLNVESKNNSGDNLLKHPRIDKRENPNQHKSRNHYAPNVRLADESNFHYKRQPNMMTGVFDKSIQRLEPPPPPPLFLGNEDKDYRILPKDVDARKPDEPTPTYSKCPTVPVAKTFTLDGKDRKVYFVNDRSFALLDDDVPRELTFQGPPKLVYIEGLAQSIELGFGGHQVKFEIDGEYNTIKFGTPGREVYINDHPYEAQFGGPAFTAMLSDDKLHRIQISGPSPQVVLSNTPVFDLYDTFCQKNQEFLKRFDSEPSIKSDIAGVSQDVDMRMNNNRRFSSFFNFPLEKMNDVNWQRIHVGDSQQTEWSVPKNSFETFKDVKPSFVTHRVSENPEWNRPVPLPELQTAPMEPPPLPPKQIINRFPGMPHPPPGFRPRYNNVNRPALLPFPNEPPRAVPPNNVPFPQPGAGAPELNQMNAPIIRRLSPPPLPPFLGNVPSTSCMTSSLLVPISSPYNNTIVSAPLPVSSRPPPLLPLPTPMTRLAAPVPVINLAAPVPVTNLAAPAPVTNLAAPVPVTCLAAPSMPSFTVPVKVPDFSAAQAPTSTTSTMSNAAPVNMDVFLEKLVAAGLIGKSSGTVSPPSVAEAVKKEDVKEEPLKEEAVPEIKFESKSLKEFHSGVISALYNGSQCATCGMRFKEIQSEQYSRHLDWHFRRNRREKDGAKKAFSRRLFYEIKDWIEYKEFEDVDERAPSYFELQANVEQPEEASPEIVVSVPCNECESETCAVCSEQFQLFWIEEEEEWHLRNAVKHDDQVYHPACYEDYKKANEPTVMDPDMSMDESAADVKEEADKFASDLKVEVKENVVDVKEETESNSYAKEEVIKSEVEEEKPLKFDGKEEKELDVDVKVEAKLNVDTKENVEEMDVDAKEDVEEVDVDTNENVEEMDVDVKDLEEASIDPVKDAKIKVKEEPKEENPGVSKELKKTCHNVESKAQELELNVHDLEVGKKIDEKESEKREEKVSQSTTSDTDPIEIDEVKSDIAVPQVVIKVEPMDTDDVKSDSKPLKEQSEGDIAENGSNTNPTKTEENKDCQSRSSSQVENVPIKFEDEFPEIEFRPPTPDPRFQVLPPVSKGEEMSNFCVIM